MTKLEALLQKASQNNSFYRDIITEYKISDPLDITHYPVLSRKKLQENRFNMFSDEGKAKYFNEVLVRQASSGSSGIPVNVYWEYNDLYASNLALWRKRLQWYGIHPNDKYIMFTLNGFGVQSDGATVLYRVYPSNLMTVNTSLIHENIGFGKLAQIINEFSPTWLYIQPYVLERLLRAYKEYNLEPPKSLRYIETVGEVFSVHLRQKAYEFFKVSIANMYGSEEMNGIAYECPFGNMHVLDENVYVECLNEEGIANQGEGEAIITNLNNHVMPLIRYRQGDNIILDETVKDCRCGCKSPVIRQIKGRVMDSLVIDGAEINTQAIFEAIAEVNNQFNDIITDYSIQYSKHRNIIFCQITIHEKNRLWYSRVKQALEEIITNKNQKITNKNFKVVEGVQNDMSKKRRVLEIIE